MVHHVDISIEALGQIFTRMSRGDAIRVEKGLSEGTKVLDAVYLEKEGIVRLYLDREGEPMVITRVVIEPAYKALVSGARIPHTPITRTGAGA